MDDKEDIADESPQALGQGPTDPPGAEPTPATPEEVALPEPAPAEAEGPKPRLYVLRPPGLRPAPRAARRRFGRLRNDCPPDRRRASNRPVLKPRLR